MDKKSAHLSQIFQIVKKQICLKKGQKFDKFIVSFFKKYCNLSDLNRCLSDSGVIKSHLKPLLRILFLKAVLPIDILQRIHLAPPPDVPLDQWVCFAGPCASSDKVKCQNYKIIKNIRIDLGIEEEGDFNYDCYESTWGTFIRDRSKHDEPIPLGSFSPVLLFPVKAFSKKVQQEIVSNFPDGKDLHHQLFLCSDHFGPSVSRLRRKTGLRSDQLMNYSLDYLNNLLDKEQSCFRPGRKNWKNFRYLPILKLRVLNQPPFAVPKPVTADTLARIKTLKVFEMASISTPFGFDERDGQNYYHQMDQIDE